MMPSFIRRALAIAATAAGERPAEIDRSPRYAFLGDHTGMVRLASGDKLFVDTRDRSLTPHLINSGRWEDHVSAIIRDLLRPGMIAIDVGANVGYHALTASRCVGANGRVIAFEPNPRLFALLRDALPVNEIANVTLLPYAASDRECEIELIVSPDNMGGGAVALPDFDRDPNLRGYERHKAITKRLDDVVAPSDAVGLIRSDAEGCDLAVLMGARRMLETSPNVAAIVEWGAFHMPSYYDVREGVARLSALGFSFWRIEKDARLGPISATQLPTQGLCDLLIMRPGAMPAAIQARRAG